MIKEVVVISNKLGLHARAAAKFVSTAAKFESSITVQCKGKTANAKSIMAVMTLAASNGTEIEITAIGADESDALNAILLLVNNKFGEGA